MHENIANLDNDVRSLKQEFFVPTICAQQLWSKMLAWGHIYVNENLMPIFFEDAQYSIS